MDSTLLLAKADFKDYADLSESLEMERLRPHILAAQLNRLRPILTEPLLDELLRLNTLATNQAPLVAPWVGLRKQCVPVVANAAMARYTPFSQTTATSNSMVRKTSQYSEPVDSRDLARQATIYDGDALTHEVALTAWLKANAASFIGFYPQATTCGATQAGRTPSVVVQGIRRPDDRPSSPIPYGR
ncbi:MAG: hypothetical protein ACRYFZ_11935 [Janthinobacterium lividum]